MKLEEQTREQRLRVLPNATVLSVCLSVCNVCIVAKRSSYRKTVWRSK